MSTPTPDVVDHPLGYLIDALVIDVSDYHLNELMVESIVGLTKESYTRLHTGLQDYLTRMEDLLEQCNTLEAEGQEGRWADYRSALDETLKLTHSSVEELDALYADTIATDD
jgi:hypothetical protein